MNIPYTNNRYLKFLYAILLLEFPIETVLSFFRPFKESFSSKLKTDKDLFDFIWNDNSEIPFHSITKLIVPYEMLICNHNLNIITIAEKHLLQFGNGTAYSTNHFLWSIKKLIPYAIKRIDIRATFLKYIHIIHKTQNFGTTHSLLKLYKKNNTQYFIIYFDCIRCKTKVEAMSFDVFFLAMTVRLAPIKFGCEPYDYPKPLCDFRNVQSAVNSENAIRIFDNKLLIDDVEYGYVCEFQEFLKKKNLELKKLRGYHGQVTVITKNLFSTKRNRIILHEGCAYSAPIHLYEISYRKSNKIKSPLFSIISDNILPNNSWIRAEEMHNRLLQSLSDNYIEVRYESKSTYIFIDGKYLTQGKQALILLYILQSFINENRTEFEHKEFIKDLRFISSLKQPGFVPRLERIIQLLKKNCSSIKVEMVGKGKFIFQSALKLNISVIEK
jgi:hypothetical protein